MNAATAGEKPGRDLPSPFDCEAATPHLKKQAPGDGSEGDRGPSHA